MVIQVRYQTYLQLNNPSKNHVGLLLHMHNSKQVRFRNLLQSHIKSCVITNPINFNITSNTQWSLSPGIIFVFNVLVQVSIHHRNFPNTTTHKYYKKVYEVKGNNDAGISRECKSRGYEYAECFLQDSRKHHFMCKEYCDRGVSNKCNVRNVQVDKRMNGIHPLCYI